jgi:UDP-N-acetylmuramate dehydrogenase
MQILLNQLLKDYTNYKIGGNTPKLYIVDEIIDFEKIPDEDLNDAYILGKGTNILVSDEGINKAVIKINFKQFFLNQIEKTIIIGSGFVLDDAIKELIEKGYKTLSNVIGIPGTIGGAIIMNASASHGAISDSLIEVEAFNKQTKQRKVFTKDECQFKFRSSIFQNSPWIITFVKFKLEEGDKENLIQIYSEAINYREKNYPLLFPSAGCCFKRDWGGKDIIEKLNMISEIRGGAIVSSMFPAFILNINNATAKDVYSLIREIQNKAKEINEDMPLEIVIWGDIK